MQRVGDHTTRFALDADAVLAAVAGGGQRVVAAYLIAVDLEPEADVLAGQEIHQRPAILGLQVERGDLLTLPDLARDTEPARTTPAAGSFGLGLIEPFLLADEQVGELLVGRRPGIDHRIGGDRLAKDLADGPQQAATDQWVVLGQHLQGDVLVDDLCHQRAEGVQLVDMPGVHQHTIGQCTWLLTAGLVRLVEQRFHLGMFAQQELVEVSGQRLAAAFQQWHGGFD